jgi:hypothetical protein
MIPWLDPAKIAVGPISPEQRKIIDGELARLIAQHFRSRPRPHAHHHRKALSFGARTTVRAVSKPFEAVSKHVGWKRGCSPEHAARLREYNRIRTEAARARKQQEAANAQSQPGHFPHRQPQVRPDRSPAHAEAYACSGVASAIAFDTAHR